MKSIVVFIVLLLLFQPKIVLGQKFKLGNESVTVQNHDVNKLSPLSSRLDDKQLKEFLRQGFIVNIGYPYLKTVDPFIFEVSDVSINLGQLIKGAVGRGQTNVTITTPSGFAVTTAEEGPMASIGNQTFIPDTSCNGGRNSCDENHAAIWTKDIKPGFGFHTNSLFASEDFLKDNYFRSFSDLKAGKLSKIIMQDGGSKKYSLKTLGQLSVYTGRIDFKAVAAVAVNESSYLSTVKFIAMPGL